LRALLEQPHTPEQLQPTLLRDVHPLHSVLVKSR
jgi:hypothetical protein